MNKGIEEAILTAPVDAEAPANSEDAVLTRLETLLSDDGSTNPNPPAEETEEEEVKAEVEDETDLDEEELADDKSDEDESDADEDKPDTDEDEEKPDDDEAEGSDDIELSEEQLTGILGLDEEGVQITDEGDLQFKVKVDKEEYFVPLKDMVDSYQFESHIRKKSQKDAEERKEFQEAKTAETERLNKTMTDAVGLVSYLEQQLSSRYSPEQLNQLRATQPDEWAAVNQEIANQSTTITNIKANIQRVIQEQQTEAANQAEGRMATYVEEQTEKLYEAMPTWIDEKVAAKEYSAMKDEAIKTYGFTEEEMMKINDHRIIRVMLDAVKGSAVKSDSPLKKRLKKVPKIVKPGNPKTTKTAVSKKKAAEKRIRIRNEGGSIQSIASALEDIL